MIDEHELIMEDVAALALGALDDDARARVEAHLQTCADCRQLLEEYRAVAGVLPFGDQLEQPPATAWSGIESRIHRTAPAAAPASTVLRPRPPQWFSRPGFLLVAGSLAAAVLVLGIFLIARAVGGSPSNQASLARKSTTNQAALSAAGGAATSVSRPPIAASAAAVASTAATSAAAATTGAVAAAAASPASSATPAAVAAGAAASPASTAQQAPAVASAPRAAAGAPGAASTDAAALSTPALAPSSRAATLPTVATPTATSPAANGDNVMAYAVLGVLAGVLLLGGGYAALRISRSRAGGGTRSR